ARQRDRIARVFPTPPGTFPGACRARPHSIPGRHRPPGDSGPEMTTAPVENSFAENAPAIPGQNPVPWVSPGPDALRPVLRPFAGRWAWTPGPPANRTAPDSNRAREPKAHPIGERPQL